MSNSNKDIQKLSGLAEYIIDELKEKNPDLLVWNIPGGAANYEKREELKKDIADESGEADTDTIIDEFNEGGNVNVKTDIELPQSASIPAGVESELNLSNDATLSVASGNAVNNSGELTVSGEGTLVAPNAAINNSGSVVIESGNIKSTGNCAICNNDGSETTINGGNITSQEANVLFVKNSTLTINDGEFTTVDNGALMGNGTSGNEGNTVTINGGTYNCNITSAGYIANAIYIPNNDTVTINGGTFNVNGGCGVCARAGQTTITGGKFHTTGEADALGKVGDSRKIVPCSPIVFDVASKYPGLTDDAKITITGGEFIAEGAGVAAVVFINDDDKVPEEVRAIRRIYISGGTFSSDVTEFCADGYKCVADGDLFKVVAE